MPFKPTKRTQIIVSEAFLGRIINAIIDSQREIIVSKFRLIESPKYF